MHFESILIKVLIVVTALAAGLIMGNFTNRRSLIRKGIKAKAIIILIEKTGINIGAGSTSKPQMKVVFEIEDSSIGNREVVKRLTFEKDDFQPAAGDRVNILIDPKNPNNIMIAPDQTKFD